MAFAVVSYCCLCRVLTVFFVYSALEFNITFKMYELYIYLTHISISLNFYLVFLLSKTLVFQRMINLHVCVCVFLHFYSLRYDNTLSVITIQR